MATGMIIDGIYGSEAIDTSGEVLDVEGADISDLEEGRGVLNYEHKDSESPTSNGQEIVGKVIYAKKIFKESDCENDRQKMYWEKVKLPFIYGIGRLYDGAGHDGARALAAQIRDHAANNEPILVRFSVEGSTLSKEGNRLKSSVIRRVALTIKPANRTADSGLLEDPNAPAGFAKNPVKDSEDILEALTSKHEHPGLARLGGSTEIEGDPRMEENQDLVKMLQKIKAIIDLRKTTTAGSYDVAPSNLTGGAALQREDQGRGQLKEKAMKLFRTFERQNEAFNKGEFRAFLKSSLPEADDSFIDRFADLIDDYKVKIAKAEYRIKGKKPARMSGPKPVLTQHDVKSVALEDSQPQGEPPLTIRGQPVQAQQKVNSFVFDEKSGILHTPRGSLPVYVPSYDKTPGAAESFRQIISDPKVEEVHDRAMENWVKCHELLKAGKLPPEVVMHSALFSMLSINTPVPVQELMAAHLADTMEESGIDARSPEFESLRQKWMDKDSPTELPKTGRQHFENLGRRIRVQNDTYKTHSKTPDRSKGDVWLRDEQGNKIINRPAGSIQSFMLASNKWENMAQYHTIHDKLMELVGKHKTDARSLVNELMAAKSEKVRYENSARLQRKKGREVPEFSGVSIPGLKQKTGRYFAGMIGAGNVFVPDTHMVRYLFGLEKGKDGDTIDYLKVGLWREGAETTKALEGIDRYYHQHHDAVKHMINHKRWGKYFKDDTEQALFPAFWANWCAIVPHERSRGYQTSGFNEGTDHMPYWLGISRFLNKSEGRADPLLVYKTAMLHRHWAQQYGEAPALALYFGHIVPELLAASQKQEGDPVIKTEALLIDLRKALDEVQPGLAVGGGRKFQVLREAPDHYVAQDKDGPVRLPKNKLGSHWQLRAAPTSAVKRAVVEDQHFLPGLCEGPEQQALVRGLDVGGNDVTHSGWGNSTQGPVFLRIDKPDRGWNTARSEAAFYNAARDVFGLGHYIPVAAAFRHPSQQVEIAAIQGVPGAEHLDMDRDSWSRGAHSQVLKGLGDSGELDKLMLQDMVLGNDRTDHGIQFSFQAEPHLRLVDHGSLDGLALHTPPPQYSPSYMAHYAHASGQVWQGMPLHENARAWLESLDFRKLEESLRRSGMPAHQVDEAVRRLVEAQAHVKKHGSTATKGSVYMAPWWNAERRG